VAERKRRPRTARRQEEEAARRLVHDRQRLALLEPGGSAARPIVVTSSSVVDLRANSHPCPLCGDTLRIVEHVARTAILRELRMACTRCGVARSLFFRIGSPLAS
jgi:hypothetical protein